MGANTVMPLVAALLLASPAVAAQSRSDQLLWAARQHMAKQQLDSAEVELRSALELAPYQVDSAFVIAWRGALPYLRGNDSLAREGFRPAANLNARIALPGLDQISPPPASAFDAAKRARRIYEGLSLEQPPQRGSWT